MVSKYNNIGVVLFGSKQRLEGNSAGRSGYKRNRPIAMMVPYITGLSVFILTGIFAIAGGIQ